MSLQFATAVCTAVWLGACGHVSAEDQSDDVFLESAKMFNYMKRRVPLAETACNILFVCFAAAFFVSRLLFQRFPIPPTLEDIRSADLTKPNLLVDAMELSKADDALASVWRGFEARNSLLEKYFALHDELLPRSSWI